MTTTQAAVRIRADIFPAVLVVAPASAPEPASLTRYPQADDPHGRKFLDKVRVLVTADTVYVFQDSADGPRVIFSERLADYTPAVPLHTRRVRDASRPAETLVTTDSGKTLAFARQGGCGCGSRLKTFNPFSVIIATARERTPTSDANHQ